MRRRFDRLGLNDIDMRQWQEIQRYVGLEGPESAFLAARSIYYLLTEAHLLTFEVRNLEDWFSSLVFELLAVFEAIETDTSPYGESQKVLRSPNLVFASGGFEKGRRSNRGNRRKRL